MGMETSSCALAPDNTQVPTDAPGAFHRRFRAKARRQSPRPRALQKADNRDATQSQWGTQAYYLLPSQHSKQLACGADQTWNQPSGVTAFTSAARTFVEIGLDVPFGDRYAGGACKAICRNREEFWSICCLLWFMCGAKHVLSSKGFHRQTCENALVRCIGIVVYAANITYVPDQCTPGYRDLLQASHWTIVARHQTLYK